MLMFSRIRAADRPYIFQKITERTAGRPVTSDYQLNHSFGTHTIVGDHLLVRILTYLTYNVHPLSGREIRALRQLRREKTESRYVFVAERGGPATTAGFLKTIARTA
jgi:hypothetical protein